MPLRFSVAELRGLANWPPMRPILTTGNAAAKVSTTAICRNTRKKSRMLSAPCSAKLSAQSPPCSRKACPTATRPSACLRLRASPANTSGGKLASWRSTWASAAASGYSGSCFAGRLRQFSGAQRWTMMLSAIPPAAAAFDGAGGGRVIHARLPMRLTVAVVRPALFGRLPLVTRRGFAHGYELLGGGRVQRHGRIEIGFPCLHGYQDRNHLHELGRVRTHDMAADDAVGRRVDDELHQHLGVAARECRLHRAEARAIDIDRRKP